MQLIRCQVIQSSRYRKRCRYVSVYANVHLRVHMMTEEMSVTTKTFSQLALIERLDQIRSHLERMREMSGSEFRISMRFRVQAGLSQVDPKGRRERSQRITKRVGKFYYYFLNNLTLGLFLPPPGSRQNSGSSPESLLR